MPRKTRERERRTRRNLKAIIGAAVNNGEEKGSRRPYQMRSIQDIEEFKANLKRESEVKVNCSQERVLNSISRLCQCQCIKYGRDRVPVTHSKGLQTDAAVCQQLNGSSHCMSAGNDIFKLMITGLLGLALC